MASEYANFNNSTFKLLKQLTPGPYTFICKTAHSLPTAFKRRKMVGIRIPNFTADTQLAKALGHPLLATSIKYEEDDYGVNPELIKENYDNKVDIMIQGYMGELIPSTIIDCTGNDIEILREGKGETNF